jgi:putative DNA primase/helicase
MALTPFRRPPRAEIMPGWTVFAMKVLASAAQGTRVEIALVETVEPEVTAEREIDTVNLASREERERLVVRYVKAYDALDADALDTALKHLYALVEGELRRDPPMPSLSHDGTIRTTYGDLFNAECLIQRHGETLRYCHVWKRWLYWTGTHWQRDHGNYVMECARETMKALGHDAVDRADQALLKHVAKSLNHQPLDRMIRQASTLPGVSVEPQEMDTQAWLLNCTNGTLDLRTGGLRPHDPDDLLSKCLTIAYDPTATCPEWHKFLWRIMGGTVPNPDNDSLGYLATQDKADLSAQRLIGFLQRALGYACTGDTGEECLFLLHGAGRNGKSKFLSTIKTLLGPYAKTADMQSFLHRDRETVRNDLADLAGTRFVCASETNEHTRLADGLIKQLTGNDNIKARFLFEEYFEFPPTFKLFLAFNHRPRTGDTDDEAFWSRIREIPFTVFIPPEERDKHLSEKLCAELPGILTWMVQGCLLWQHERSLGEPVEVIEATATYRTESDRIGRFLTECCYVKQGDESVRVPAQRLFKAFAEWCEANAEGPSGSGIAFGRALTTRGFPTKLGTDNKTFRLGVGLAAESPSGEREG